MLKAYLRSRIRRRLGNYRITLNAVDSTKPSLVSAPVKVAVIGAGLAGITAASTLAERGFHVALFERNGYLGGKVGCWDVTFPDGHRARIDHGFHAFFRHYYNLRAFLEKIGADRRYRAIDDYLILASNGSRYGFKNVETTPVLNILALARQKFFRFRDVAMNPASRRLGEFLNYEERRTFAAYDAMTFKEFAEQAKLPAPLALTFNTFARAFFAPAEKLSTAELMKSFHFFYLSHDHGLLYDFFDTDYRTALLEPIASHLQRHGVTLRLSSSVEKIGRDRAKFIVHDEPFDALILATDAAATREIGRSTAWIESEAPGTFSRLMSLQASTGYAVYRLWLDRRLGAGLPVFVITEKKRVLDSVTFYHRFDEAAVEWSDRTGGGVYELHCYALPEAIDETRVKEAFLAELYDYFPELRAARIVYENLQVRRDFTAFYAGLHASRPGYRTEIPGLYLAGDWVNTGTPAMLMEAACTAGLLCANALLAEQGLREEAVHSVPLRGLCAKAG